MLVVVVVTDMLYFLPGVQAEDTSRPAPGHCTWASSASGKSPPRHEDSSRLLPCHHRVDPDFPEIVSGHPAAPARCQVSVCSHQHFLNQTRMWVGFFQQAFYHTWQYVHNSMSTCTQHILVIMYTIHTLSIFYLKCYCYKNGSWCFFFW